MEHEFDAGTFREIANSATGQEIWKLLNEHDNLIRMETATFLSRPAVEALSPVLLSRIGEEVRQDRMKQMVGRMVRQILERCGYQIDQQSVRIPKPNVFTSGTRYIERG